MTTNDTRIFVDQKEKINVGMVRVEDIVIFGVKLPNTSTAVLKKLELCEGNKFLKLSGFAIKQITSVKIEDNCLRVKGVLNNHQDFEKFKVEDLGIFDWKELLEYADCKYNNNHFLQTYKLDTNQTDYNFVYTFPQSNSVSIEKYFGDDKEDPINKIEKVVPLGNDIVVKGRKAKGISV
ncbi:hypothetical protein ABEX78_21165 [Priestia megaterium]